jgi:hypothetical protein
MVVALAAGEREGQALQETLSRSWIWSFEGEADAQCLVRPSVRRPASVVEGKNEGTKIDAIQLGASVRLVDRVLQEHGQCRSWWGRMPSL